MKLLSRDGRNVELRFAEFGSSSIPIPFDRGGAGVPIAVTPDVAFGLPAVTACIRLISETVASMPLLVYRKDGENRERADDASQYALFRVRPNRDQSPHDFISDIAASLEGFGNAYIRKIYAGKEVVELVPLPPASVSVTQDSKTGELSYAIASSTGVERDLTSREILHIRGFAPQGGPVGISPITAHRDALAAPAGMQRFLNAYMSRGAGPGVVLSMPQQVTREQARELAETWDSQHAGIDRAGSTAVIGGGATLQTIPVSMVDAQFVESMRFSVEQVARIFNVPAALLDAGDRNGMDTQALTEQFVKFCLVSRMSRIERALAADPDLFATTGNLYPEFLADGLLRPSTRERFESYKTAIQTGIFSQNEVRRLENYPPIAGGDEIQITPVGGAPNPQPIPESPTEDG